MNTEKKVNIIIDRGNGPEQIEVELLYCAAAEMGYERTSGRKIGVFAPTIDPETRKITAPSKADTSDLIYLAVSCIVAAYARQHKEPPVNADDIIYYATPLSIIELITATSEARREWYKLPETLEKELAEEQQQQQQQQQQGDDAKN